MSLLLDLEERLVHLQDLFIILLLEVGGHRNSRTCLTLLEIARLRAHIEAHITNFISLVMAIARHDDGALKLIEYSLLELLRLRRVAGVAVALLSEAFHLLIDELQAVVNRQILADIVDDQVEATLEDP